MEMITVLKPLFALVATLIGGYVMILAVIAITQNNDD